MQSEITAPFIAVNRHRIGTDGVGVTTLVAFHGCPLRCRYCLNPQCLQAGGVWRRLTPGELYSEVEIDDLYFVATGGGLCFGGGEPLLYSEFIRTFSGIMNPEWRLTVETSLNVPLENIESVAALIQTWYIDIKDLTPAIYNAYTGKDNAQVLRNLEWLSANGYADKVIVRLPLIPGYNTEATRLSGRRRLEAMGFARFDQFTYLV